MGVAGAIALAEALKVAVVTCGQEFHEDALVWCSPVKYKQLMPVFSCISCCERNRTPGCLAQKRCANVFGKCGTVQRLMVESSTDYAWDPDFFLR